MNSSPVMVSFSYRYLASSSSFSRFSFRMPVAFSCCFFTMEMTSRSISAWVPAEQAREAGIEISHVASATGSGGTTAGLVLGTSLFLPQAKATGLGVDTDPFEEIVSELVKEAAGLVGQPVPTDMDSRFRMIYHVGAGYAIPNAEDTPYIEELARQEGILLDPVYTGKAWAKFLMLVKEGYFDGQEHIAFVHTGGAAALFAMELG